MKVFSKKWTIPVLTFIVALIVLRFFLPSIAKHYVNKSLNEMDGYKGSVDDIDVHLYRGAYSINDLIIRQIKSGVEVPFFRAANIDLSVHWGALLDGEIVGEIVINKPVLNFAQGPGDEELQSGAENDWVETTKSLIPLRINRLEIKNGTMTYLDDYSDPNVDLRLTEFNAEALNLTNAEAKKGELPSKITVKSKAVGGGDLDANMDLNALKEIPDFDLDIKLENVNMVELNNYLKAYTKIDVERGNLNFYSEVSLVDGQLEGYAKPLITDLKILRLKEGGSIFSKAWEGIAGLFVELFTNQPNDKFATKVPVSGSIENFDTSVWGTILATLRNAYINPFKDEIDQTIDVDGNKK